MPMGADKSLYNGCETDLATPWFNNPLPQSDFNPLPLCFLFNFRWISSW